MKKHIRALSMLIAIVCVFSVAVIPAAAAAEGAHEEECGYSVTYHGNQPQYNCLYYSDNICGDWFNVQHTFVLGNPPKGTKCENMIYLYYIFSHWYCNQTKWW